MTTHWHCPSATNPALRKLRRPGGHNAFARESGRSITFQDIAISSQVIDTAKDHRHPKTLPPMACATDQGHALMSHEIGLWQPTIRHDSRCQRLDDASSEVIATACSCAKSYPASD